jgi:hypothetical protein
MIQAHIWFTFKGDRLGLFQDNESELTALAESDTEPTGTSKRKVSVVQDLSLSSDETSSQAISHTSARSQCRKIAKEETPTAPGGSKRRRMAGSANKK